MSTKNCFYLYFCKNIACLHFGLLSISQVFSFSCRTVYQWVMTNCCFVSNVCLQQTWMSLCINQSINQSINPLACTGCGDSLPFSGASSIPPCHTLFPATPLRRPFFHPPSLHPAICFLVYLLVLLFPNSYTILFWESYFLPFSVHVQTIVIYAALLSLL